MDLLAYLEAGGIVIPPHLSEDGEKGRAGGAKTAGAFHSHP